MSGLRATFVCAGAAAVLAGCALATIGPADPLLTYDLVSYPAASAREVRRAGGMQVVVNEPAALRSLAGDRIAVRPSASEIRYFGKVTWSDQLPRLVQARLIEALGRSGRFAAVASSRERLEADVAIATEIRAFQIELRQRQPVARVDLYVRVIDQRRARVIAGRGFSEETPARNDDAVSGVEALNAAMRSVLPRVAAWAGRIQLPAPPPDLPRRVRSSPRPPETLAPDDTGETDLPLRDSQTDERETDPDARPPISPDLLIGRRHPGTGQL